MEQTIGGILLSDPQGYYVEANSHMCAMLGYEKEQLLGLRLEDLTPPELTARLGELRSPLPAGTSLLIDWMLLRKDGTHIPVEMKVSRSGNRYLSIVRDITRRQRKDAVSALLHRVNQSILKDQPVKRILSMVCEELLSIYSLTLSFVGAKNADGSVELCQAACTNPEEIPKLNIRWDDTPCGHGPSGEALRTGKTQMISCDDPRFAPWAEQVQRYAMEGAISVPMSLGNNMDGVLCIYGKKGYIWNEELKLELERVAQKITNVLQFTHHRQEANLLRSALRATANSVVITDAEGKICWLNSAFSALTGYAEAEALGENPRFLRSSLQDDSFYQHLWSTITSGQPWHGELINKRKDGSLYHEEMTITPIWDADAAITHFVAVKQDITARKEAQLALETYRMFFHNARDKMFLLDTDGIIIAANQAVEQTYGYTSEELQGLSIRELRAPETLEDWPEQMQTARATDILFETTHKHKEGATFPVEVRSCQAILAGKQSLLRIVRDISVRKKAEQEASEAQQRAAQAERMALIGTMAAAITHEINQPLNALQLTADGPLYLHHHNKPIDPQRLWDALEKISKQSRRISSIIQSMRSFVRSGSEKTTSSCDLNEAVLAAAESLRSRLMEEGIQLQIELDKKVTYVPGDSMRLEEAITNLLVNAEQALGAADLAATKQIALQTHHKGDYVILEVRDNGPGFQSDILPRAFEPFVSTKAVGHGMGLGLAIVRSLMQAYGGDITAENIPTGGACIRVVLPQQTN